MASIDEMMGVGLESEEAKAWVGSKDTATATGSTTADAVALSMAGVIVVSGADGTKGANLNANLPTDSTQIIVNSAGSALKMYSTTGITLNGVAAGTAVNIAANTSALIIRVSATQYAMVSK